MCESGQDMNAEHAEHAERSVILCVVSASSANSAFDSWKGPAELLHPLIHDRTAPKPRDRQAGRPHRHAAARHQAGAAAGHSAAGRSSRTSAAAGAGTRRNADGVTAFRTRARRGEARRSAPARPAEQRTAVRRPSARRDGDRRMSGDVEELRQPQHHVAHRLLRSADLHCAGADRRRRNRQRRQHERIVLRRAPRPLRAAALRGPRARGRNPRPARTVPSPAAAAPAPCSARASCRAPTRDRPRASARTMCRYTGAMSVAWLIVDVVDVRAGRAQPIRAPPRIDARDLVVQQIAEVRPRHREAQTRDRHRRRQRAPHVAEQGVIDEARVGDGPRQRADVIERARQRHDAVGRHLAERRLQTDDAACRGGNADRSAGVGADRGERHAGGDARRRSAARAAGRS